MRWKGLAAGALLVPALVAGCGAPAGDAGDGADAPDPTTAPQPNPLRNAYYGDLHVHTRFSMDAYIFDVRATPDDAYRFARGAPLVHPAGHTMQLRRPLDFQAVTDHGILLGVLPAMDDPDDPLYQVPLARELRELGPSEGFQRGLQAYRAGEFHKIDGKMAGHDAWQRIIESAERHNDPGAFTTFIGYEYTTTAADTGNLHRNVIFRGDRKTAVTRSPLTARDVPLPFTAMDSDNPEDLWYWLDRLRADGIEALAIPHNSNGSNGNMFSPSTFGGDPLDAEYAETRMRNEPIVEVTQVKGTSEVHPMLSPNDEWADFEIMPYRVSSTLPSEPQGSYVRTAYLDGLLLEETQGFNPFRFGLVAATDSHNAGGTPDEDDYHSKVGRRDGTPQLRGSVPLDEPNADGSPAYAQTYFQMWSASGLTGVWAEENTRDSIYDAFRRKETFATTGPRIQVRFFGGYDFDADLADDPEMIAKAYEQGVAMGGDLLADGERAPKLLLWASGDPESAGLQRLQVVKGWVDGGEAHETVIDVACSDGGTPAGDPPRCPDNGAVVDLSDCSFSEDLGAAELRAVFEDPAFDPGQRAVYYLRVLENPTCRWSTWDAIRAGVDPRPGVPTTIQERAWSSPIWYRP